MLINKWLKRHSALLVIRSLPAAYFLSLFLMPSMATAVIRFEDVSERSGIYRPFSTAASAWGDVNGDGWPDLWVSNHWHQPPSLYLNQKDGTFIDVAADTLVGDFPADFHGAGWADFDNDGDQDLMVTTGGGAGEGKCPNYLFVSDGAQLHDQAHQFDLDYSFGRGRTPLWFDADRDGRLDLLVMNRFRPGGKAPSAIFLQTEKGFVPASERLKFYPSGQRSLTEKGMDLFTNLINFRFTLRAGAIKPAEVFPLFADLTGDRHLDLIAFVKPMRAYSVANVPFKEITAELGLPNASGVKDAVIEDFNGDHKMDIFLAISSYFWGVNQVDPATLKGVMRLGNLDSQTIRFRSRGDVTFYLYTPWIDPSAPQNPLPQVAIGNRPPMPIDGTSVQLNPEDPSIHHPPRTTDRIGIAISYDPDQQLWQLKSVLPYFNVVINATHPIEQLDRVEFNNDDGARNDTLLINGPKGFKVSPDSNISGSKTASWSVVAGDFDNDMDMDLYLVCAGLAQNLPNILMENDGNGHFTRVPEAGGAAGSQRGIGNQVTSADYDQDGFLDLFVTNGAGNPPFSYEGPHQLFRNMGNQNHWLEIDLIGTDSNRDGIGTVVELEAGGMKQVRNQGGGIHSFSQNHARIHFGLGPHTRAERITVRWPSGLTSELVAVDADQLVRISETQPEQ